MVRLVYPALFVLLFAVLASGCTSRPDTNHNATSNETTIYEYKNISANISLNETASKDFSFKIHGDESEFWLKPNASASFYVVFNNAGEDESSHTFIARVFPSAADFDVMAAYECLYFTTCEPLLSHMRLMIDQPEKPLQINYTFVGLYQINIRIPSNTSAGTYMYNAMACRDKSFSECSETSMNFGPTIPIAVHVL